ncbi:MAG: DNA polymerase III subunit gamma/tau [Solobacterium sp.]|nr:DNA polymerase III subunit gamma/tau [Solobacterium sp.]
MSSIALYQKYRSQSFDELVGQEYVVRAIRNAVKENKVGHAYLFCGPRGTGKTSMARLLARAVNCSHPESAPCNECDNCKAAIEGSHPDIIEINAANETHVEDIRDLIDRARLSPMMGKHKIYIIDEVHQLSSSAASALLKTLEEPPEHVIFILATTDPQKLLKTIISRCQRFDFSKVDAAKIQNHLLGIAEKEGFTLEPEAALKIAELADGGMRDSLSILEQARAYGAGEITESTIDSIFGLASSGEKIALLEDIFNGNLEGVLQRVESCETHGVDIRRLTEDLITALKDGLIFQYTNKEGLLHSLSRQHAETVSQRSASELLAMIEVLMKAQERYRSAQSVSSVFEIACLELIAGGGEEPQPVSPVRKTSARAKSEPAVTEPEPEEPAPNEQPAAPVVDVPQELSVDDVLALLVQCNKAEKQIAEEGLRALGAGPMMDRYTASLRQLDLKAAGKDVLLFTASEAVVHMVSEEAFNRELYTVLKSHTLDRMPFVITRGRYEEAVNAFRVRSKDHTLPEPKAIERWQELIQNDDQAERTEESVMNLFGKENVEVIDEGD